MIWYATSSDDFPAFVAIAARTVFCSDTLSERVWTRTFESPMVVTTVLSRLGTPVASTAWR